MSQHMQNLTATSLNLECRLKQRFLSYLRKYLWHLQISPGLSVLWLEDKLSPGFQPKLIQQPRNADAKLRLCIIFRQRPEQHMGKSLNIFYSHAYLLELLSRNSQFIFIMYTSICNSKEVLILPAPL